MDKLPDPNPWHPMSDPVDLKVMGKLGEEATELGSAVCRCIIQGIDEFEPVTGKINRRWLEDEMADVIANMELVAERWGLDMDYIGQRVSRKKEQLRIWHAQA